MKNIFILVLSLSTLFIHAQNSVEPFEGVLKVTNSSTPELISSFYVKGNNVASYFGSEDKKDKNNQRFIINSKLQTEIALKKINGKKKAVKSKRVALNLPQEYKDSQKALGVNKFNKTGEKKEIQGYNCEKVVVSNNKYSLTAWVTKDVSVTLKNTHPFNTNGMDLIFAAASYQGVQNGLVMEANKINTASGKSTTYKTTIEKKKIKQKEFEVPSGYELVDNTKASIDVRMVSPMERVNAAQDKIKATMQKIKEMEKAKEASGTVAPAPEKQ